MRADERSFRIALVADRFVNPPPGGVDAVAAAAQAGWGVMQLPPDDYPAGLRGGGNGVHPARRRVHEPVGDQCDPERPLIGLHGLSSTDSIAAR